MSPKLWWEIWLATAALLLASSLPAVGAELSGEELIQAVDQLLNTGVVVARGEEEGSVVAAAVAVPAVLDAFKEFLVEFNRTYADMEELKHRFGNFHRTFHLVKDFNRREKETKEGTARYGIGKFADWSEEERSKMLIPFPPETNQHPFALRWLNASNIGLSANMSTSAEPLRLESFDWRAKNVITRVKNQGQCGSCWAFAATAAVESHYAIAHQKHVFRNRPKHLPEPKLPLAILSEQELVDCVQGAFGCNGGWADVAMEYVLTNGLAPAASYPYTARDTRCRTLPKMLKRARLDRVDRLVPGDEVAAANYLAEHGPFTVGMAVPESILHYQSGVWDPSAEECAHALAGHALTVVGYGTETMASGTKVDYWLMKNSWGAGWARLGGYIKIRRGANVCHIADDMVAPVIQNFRI